MSERLAIVWFRQDLRLTDNPALAYAASHYERLLPIFIDDTQSAWTPGAASRWWLHHSLIALQKSLHASGSDLLILAGDAEQQIQHLLESTGAMGLFWNRRYTPDGMAQDRRIKQICNEQGISVQSFNANLWFEPWELTTQQNSAYKVFTPYWNKMLQHWRFPQIASKPEQLPPPPAKLSIQCVDIDSVLPSTIRQGSHWDAAFSTHWQPGEQGAQQALDEFMQTALDNYPDDRDRPDTAGTSQLSPYLAWGNLSIRQLVRALCPDGQPPLEPDISAYVRQLAWREFSHYLLFHHPDFPSQPLRSEYRDFAWRKPAEYTTDLKAWQQGQTGIPIIDAGMRQLWQIGWMHNRVRMLVASLLTKNLLIPWQEGARWFWDTLVDADLANNSQGWQWTAGCGVDASPYFRIFNPVTQGERYDPHATYIKTWVPELRSLTAKAIHSGATANSYPAAIVDLKSSRQRALDAYHAVKI